jgi:serine/threonine-protein kinase RsbW
MAIDFSKNPVLLQNQMALKKRKSFELTIPSRLEEMGAVHALVEMAVKEFKLDEELAHWIELTVSESVINAIQHGNESDPAKEARLKISSDGVAIEVIVEDQGKGFNFDDVADPTDVKNLLKPSGRGILIIRSFMDEVDLSPCEGGGCRLRMIKKLPRGGPQ